MLILQDTHTSSGTEDGEQVNRTTILSEETDPNKLHDLKADLDGHQVYAWDDIVALVDLYLGGADRDRLDPILDLILYYISCWAASL